ncbi:SNF2 family N-terminal domain-containing protein [Hyaloraphidium curvatum]|nr:SNF2 family N-terminal domain-containing protein [Hyaloraphidium curvatum]
MDDGGLKRRSEAPDDGGQSKYQRLAPDERSAEAVSSRRPVVTTDVVVEVENDSDVEKYRFGRPEAARASNTGKRSRRKPSDEESARRGGDRGSSNGGGSDVDMTEYEVKGIEAKYVERNGRVLYKVRWANGEVTKEPIENLDGCIELVEAFEHRTAQDHDATEPSLRRWYLSDQKPALGYNTTEREPQGFNADSDEDGVAYESGSDDEEDEEGSGEDDGQSGLDAPEDNDADAGPSGPRQISVDANSRSDAAVSLPSAQGDLQPSSAKVLKSEPRLGDGGAVDTKKVKVERKPLKKTFAESETGSVKSAKDKAKVVPKDNRKLATHHAVCQRCGMGSLKGKRARNDDTLEDVGELQYCTLCSNIYHEGCVYMRRKKKVAVAGDDFICPMCRKETPVCVICGAGFDDEAAFRCDRCSAVAHDACLLVAFDEEFKAEYDEELEATEGSPYWFRRKFKCIDCIRWSDEVAQILTYRDVEKAGSPSREYLVKYRNYSHRHNSWVGERWLANLNNGKQRFKTFWRKVEEENEQARKWGLAKLPWPKAEDEAVLDEWKHVDRIIDVKFKKGKVSVKKEDSKEDELRKRLDKVLVKFRGQPWSESFWEDFPSSRDKDYAEFAAAFDVFRKRESLGASKSGAGRGRQLRFIELSAQPESLKGGILKDYQLEGLNWLLFNHSERRSCILADEMGLGKTIQTIAFLNYLLEKNGLFPFLIVVPQSTLLNWIREFGTWAPQMEVLAFYGDKASREVMRDYALFQSVVKGPKDAKLLKCHVLLTTPDTLQTETKVFQDVKWEVLIVDEGHQRVKNAESLQFEALISLNTLHRVLLTGTPVQNNLLEMFNLLHFLDPEAFPDPEALSAQYTEGLNKDKLAELHGIVRPYILRRIKSDVLQALPGKSETIVPVGLSLLQRSLYKQILLDNYEILATGHLKKKTATARAQLVSKVLADIRRLLQHPYLLPNVEPSFSSRSETHRRLIESSGKLYLLDKMVHKLMGQGHRILIFSTMKLVLDILEDYLLGEKIKYCRLDGETALKDRQERIDLFNAPGSDISVFILTTRAGGLGINLTTADSVIIWDSDWNPHQDLQALARAHRIGQKNHVLVWKFVTKGTAEERIFQIAKKKLILDHLVVQKLEQESLDEKDVESVLRFGAEQLFSADESNNEMSLVYDDAAIDKLLERKAEEERPQQETDKKSSFSFARVWTQTSSAEHAPVEDLEVADVEEATEVQTNEEQGDAFWERCGLLPARRLAPLTFGLQDCCIVESLSLPTRACVAAGGERKSTMRCKRRRSARRRRTDARATAKMTTMLPASNLGRTLVPTRRERTNRAPIRTRSREAAPLRAIRTRTKATTT